MAQQFKALVVTEHEEGQFTRSIETRSVEDLPQGDLLIKVHYSSLNYKDALSATGNRGVTRKFPHTPGIDAAGEVIEDASGTFQPGDQVVVQVRVKEGNRERLQAYEGVVIAKKNRGLNSSFTVRKISHGEGVERVFQTHSPSVASVKVKRRGDVRRAKLYYLRERSGKSARIKEKIG